MACSWGWAGTDGTLDESSQRDLQDGCNMDSPKRYPHRPDRQQRARRPLVQPPRPCPAAARPKRWQCWRRWGVGAHWLSNQRVEIPRGEQLLRRNTWTDGVDVLPEGSAWVLPGVHTARQLPARDLTLRATRLASHRSPQALQTVEGLSVGLEVNLRVALDAANCRSSPANCPSKLVPLRGARNWPACSMPSLAARCASSSAPSAPRSSAACRPRSPPKLAAEGLILRTCSLAPSTCRPTTAGPRFAAVRGPGQRQDALHAPNCVRSRCASLPSQPKLSVSAARSRPRLPRASK